TTAAVAAATFTGGPVRRAGAVGAPFAGFITVLEGSAAATPVPFSVLGQGGQGGHGRYGEGGNGCGDHQ
ncbi:MAG: hypothetical protein RJB12_1450, partial [Pseudomonadota bacterium]